MEIIFTVTESTLVAELLGELDHHAAEGTREKIDRLWIITKSAA